MKRRPHAGRAARQQNGPGGGALPAEEIIELSEPRAGREPLISDLIKSNLKGAAYDLRMAEDGLVLPNGIVIRPNDGRRYRQGILLEPGQTIFVSTAEQLAIPRDLVGNISIKGELAGRGVLALTGLIVDPKYHRGGSGDGRLHFRLSNLGHRPVLLQPGVTKVASIQFVRLTRPTEFEPGHSFDTVWESVDELQEGLGFLEDLREVEARLTRVETEQERQGRAVNQVVVAVLFVVAVTLLGVATTGLLTLGSDAKLVDASKEVIPDDTSDKWVGVAALFALAVLAHAIVSGFRARRRREPEDAQSVSYARREALTDLRMERVRRAGLLASVASLSGVGGLALVTQAGVPWWIVALVILGALAFLLWRGWEWMWWSLPRYRVDDRVRQWEREALNRARAVDSL